MGKRIIAFSLFLIWLWLCVVSIAKIQDKAPKNFNTNTECIKGIRYVIVDDRKIRLRKYDKNAVGQVSDIYCYDYKR